MLARLETKDAAQKSSRLYAIDKKNEPDEQYRRERNLLVSGHAAFLYGWLHQPEHEDAQVGAIVGGSAIYAASLAMRGGVIEEILFRGLAIEQLTLLTGRKWLSAFLATLVFVMGHVLHFDWAQLVPISAVSVVVVSLYLWRKDLWANIIAHTLIDLIAVLAVVFHLSS